MANILPALIQASQQNRQNLNQSIRDSTKRLEMRQIHKLGKEFIQEKDFSPENIQSFAQERQLEPDQMKQIVEMASEFMKYKREMTPEIEKGTYRNIYNENNKRMETGLYGNDGSLMKNIGPSEAPPTPESPETVIKSLMGKDGTPHDFLINKITGDKVKDYGPSVKKTSGAKGSVQTIGDGTRAWVGGDGEVGQIYGKTTQQTKYETGEKEKTHKRQMMAESIVADTENVNSVIDDALIEHGYTVDETTGELVRPKELSTESMFDTKTGLPGWVSSKWPGQTDARDLQSKYDTIVANVVIDTIKEMKTTSHTGATGFGQLNLKELETIQDKVRKLDRLTDPKLQVESLLSIKKYFQRIHKMAQDEQTQPELNQPKPNQPVQPNQNKFSEDPKVNEVIAEFMEGQ
ncbi:hypothetical protein [Pseudoalteromonas sp.]|uniref:hypothetical protein n=1 Tax=Pseudoalteromonas sp. TaxID=53249 RepID=UPI00262678E3|nr:hypothetical protein [Pseudoalteromonas sp.]MCP4585321.1 hypothetical protein [Pseudoalteromonas sp.]